MTNISAAAEANREHARAANGQFGTQAHTPPAPAPVALSAKDAERMNDAAVRAVLFSNHDIDDDSQYEYLDERDLPVAAAARARLQHEMTGFLAAYPDLAEQLRARPDYGFPEQFAHDYVFTAQREGTGFWDRPELRDGDLGDRLTDAVQEYSQLEYAGWYVNDDNEIDMS